MFSTSLPLPRPFPDGETEALRRITDTYGPRLGALDLDELRVLRIQVACFLASEKPISSTPRVTMAFSNVSRLSRKSLEASFLPILQEIICSRLGGE